MQLRSGSVSIALIVSPPGFALLALLFHRARLLFARANTATDAATRAGEKRSPELDHVSIMTYICTDEIY